MAKKTGNVLTPAEALTSAGVTEDSTPDTKAEPVFTKDRLLEPVFTKDQLIKSKRYQNQRDVLEAVLNEESAYSHAEAEEIIENFMKVRVK